MKKYIIAILIFTLITSFLIGFYLYKLRVLDEEIAFEAEYKKLESENKIIELNNIIEETGSLENVITPNTLIIEKKYYNDCEHIIENSRKNDEKLINKNESELQIEYIGWEIQKFTPKEVVIYKEINDFCNEHYLLRDINGKINIFKLDKYGKEKELVEETEIQTMYLPEKDLQELKNGKKAYGKKELGQLLQDYE